MSPLHTETTQAGPPGPPGPPRPPGAVGAAGAVGVAGAVVVTLNEFDSTAAAAAKEALAAPHHHQLLPNEASCMPSLALLDLPSILPEIWQLSGGSVSGPPAPAGAQGVPGGRGTALAAVGETGDDEEDDDDNDDDNSAESFDEVFKEHFDLFVSSEG